MAYNLNEVISKFDITNSIEPYGDGHINDTYLAKADTKFILQRINHSIFKNPEKLMENIQNVTEHLGKKIKEEGGDVTRETLTIIKTLDGKSFYKDEDGNYFRMYVFIDNATTYQKIENPMHFYSAAKAFGKFQKNLADFPAESLYESIPNFHNTVSRFEDFKKAVEEDKMGRAKDVQKEIEFAFARAKDCGIIVDAIASGEVPVRVTHNDTKLNNVMIDDATGEGLCVIDLDTVMPGSLLYDYGDSMRFGTNNSDEDDKNLDNVFCRLDLFEAFTKGYMEELRETLTPKEIELLPFSAKLMTFECGIRFLGDHLNGDTYFKIHRENHNLDRARTQFKLVYDMEQKEEEMKKIVAKYL
jgi:Ser/Thr protein kinase RdoA (MazF antagonist)